MPKIQWTGLPPALRDHLFERLRERKITAQSPAECRFSAFNMLQLGGMLPVDPAREQRSGLIEMQRLFARGHGCRRT